MTSRSMNRSIIFRALKIREQRPRLLLDYKALCGVFTKKCAWDVVFDEGIGESHYLAL